MGAVGEGRDRIYVVKDGESHSLPRGCWVRLLPVPGIPDMQAESRLSMPWNRAPCGGSGACGDRVAERLCGTTPFTT